MRRKYTATNCADIYCAPCQFNSPGAGSLPISPIIFIAYILNCPFFYPDGQFAIDDNAGILTVKG